MPKRAERALECGQLSGLENLVEAFEGFGRKLTSQDEDRKRSNTAEDEIRENGISISGSRCKGGRVRFKRENGLFDSGALLVDVVEMFSTSWNVARIKTAVRKSVDISGTAVGIGAGIKASRERLAIDFKRERAKEFESWSAVFTFTGAVWPERLVTGFAERNTIFVKIGRACEFSGTRIDGNDGASESAMAEQKLVRGGVIESGIADKCVADKPRMTLEKA